MKNLDLILIPVNLNNRHWVLVAVELSRKRFSYFDPLYEGDKHGVLLKVKRGLIDQIKTKSGSEELAKMNVREWHTRENPIGTLRQKDDSSCGVFILYMADYFALGKSMNFKEDNIEVLRQRTERYIGRGKLEDHPDPNDKN